MGIIKGIAVMECDIVVIGAGPTGLSFARFLSRSGLSVILLEKETREVVENPAYDGREIALTHFSKDIMQKFGMWEAISDNEIHKICNAKVLNGMSPYALEFHSHESQKSNLGYMISNHVIRKAAYDSLASASNIELRSDSEVSAVVVDECGVNIRLKDGSEITASLVVSADSRFSATRRMMGLPTDMLDFGRVCIVCKMSIDGDHAGTALECFYFDRTLAILPLGKKEVSVVITINSNESSVILSMNPAEFSAEVEKRIKGALGHMELITPLYSYPLVATYARKFYSNRYAVIGDAAVGMHPVTAHGFNLGLKGAYFLAQCIIKASEAGRDFSSQMVLKEYNRLHRHASRPLYLATNSLVRLYTDISPPAKIARSFLLRLGNRIEPAKRVIVKQLTKNCI